MRLASFDLGSNTFILMICEVDNSAITKILHDEVFYTRLSDLDENQKMTKDCVSRVEEAFKKASNLIKEYKVDLTLCAATSAARDMKSQKEFLELGHKYNIPIEIISGQKEASLSFEAVTSDLEYKKDFVVLDIGGFSTEIINDKNVLNSLNIGSVRLYKQYFKNDPPHSDETTSLIQEIKKHLDSLPDFKSVSHIIATSGTPHVLAHLQYNLEAPSKQIHNKILSLSQIRDLKKKLFSMNVKERINLIKEEKRADVILSGICILEEVVSYFKLDQIQVSALGLRHGLVLSYLKGKKNQ